MMVADEQMGNGRGQNKMKREGRDGLCAADGKYVLCTTSSVEDYDAIN